MTTRAKTPTKPAATTRRSKKLVLGKKTLADLSPRRSEGAAVRGGGIKSGNCG